MVKAWVENTVIYSVLGASCVARRLEPLLKHR